MRRLNSLKVWSAITAIALTVALLLTFLPMRVSVNTGGLLSIRLDSSSAQNEVNPVPRENQPTDPEVLKALQKAGIDKNYVKLIKDYGLKSDDRSPYSLTYKDLKSNTYVDLISQLPMVNADNVKVEVGWETKDGKNFTSKINQFIATVSETKTTVTCFNDQPDGKVKKDNVLTCQPQLFLDNKEIKLTNKTPTLLAIDPTNENYQNNVLEWDYGICKRRLRLIEGKLLGTWIFAQNPNGTVRIKYNQSGDFKLHFGQYAVSDDEELIPAEAFENPIFGYPFIISDSLTFYPDAHSETTSVDGYAFHYQVNQTWATIHDGAGTTADDASNIISQQIVAGTTAWNYILRSPILFDTSGLPDTAIISAATLSIYGETKDNTLTGSPPTVNIFASNPTGNTAVIAGDYVYTRWGTTKLCDTDITYANWLTNAVSPYWNNFTLNAAGIALISLTSITKFGIRESTYDVPNIAPSWAATRNEGMNGYSAEQGTGYKPKLVVTYTVTPEITNTPSSYGFGILQVNTTGNTAINYFTIENTGNCAVNVTIQGTDLTGGDDDTWTLADDGSPGENTYGLYAGLNNESLYESSDSTDYQVQSAGALWHAQAFTPSITHTISKVSLKLYRVGSPGTITVSIRTASNGLPTGGDLCSGTTNGDTLTTDIGGEWGTINFSSGYELSASTQYAIVLRAPSGTLNTDTAYWKDDSYGNPYASGTGSVSQDSGDSWSNEYYETCDFTFREYGHGFNIVVKKSETYNTLVSDLAEDATQDWGLKIYMPTSLSGYDAQQMSGTITLVASAA